MTIKITSVELTPLRIPYKQPFHWAQGVIDAADVVLVTLRSDAGLTGHGESMSSISPAPVETLLRSVAPLCIGRSPFEVNAIVREAYQMLFAARGNCSAPRFGAMILAGLDMALWDLAGKAAGCAVHELLGGALHDAIHYFGFPQGATGEEIAREAGLWVETGARAIYVKIGRGEARDLDIISSVRGAIGNHRLRVDANEAWDMLTARRMAEKLAPFDIEFLEQPTPSNSLEALRDLSARSPIPIAADQAAFTPEDTLAACSAADLVVLGLHETGGVRAFIEAAGIARAHGRNICLHGLYETGITTCASNQVGAAIANLDDGNQYMNHLLVEDVVTAPALALRQGALPVLGGPGFGFELDDDAVGRAAERARKAAR